MKQDIPGPTYIQGDNWTYLKFNSAMSYKRNSSITNTDELYSVTVNNLRMCMNEVNPGLKYFRGDNWTYLVW